MKWVAAVLALVVSATTMACDEKSDMTAVNSCADLAGNYLATSFTATGTSNTTLSRNFLTGGGAFALTFNDGTFTSSYLAAAGTSPLVRTGAFTASSGSITLGTQALFTGAATGSQVYTCTTSGSTLVLTAPGTSFDFTGTGTAVPARVDITLTKI